MGILADAFLFVVDPILENTIDPLRRKYRSKKTDWGLARCAGDYSSVSSNIGKDTLIARNLVLGWLIYSHTNGTQDARFVGTKRMLQILSDERDPTAYPNGLFPHNDVANFIPEPEKVSSAPKPA